MSSLTSGTALWSGFGSTDTASITSPLTGSVVSGTSVVNMVATSTAQVSNVKLYVDGAYYAADSSSPYSIQWGTTKYAEGIHTLYAVTYDTQGGSATSATVALVVKNHVADTISITSPLTGFIVFGTTPVKVSAYSSAGITKVQRYVDGVLYATSTTSPYTFSWNTLKYSGGVHTLYVKLCDKLNNFVISKVVTVTVVHFLP